nr:RNA methyltransferase [Phytoactinopolyspora alkaliphila]
MHEVHEAGDPRLADYVSLRDVQLRTSLESRHGLFLAEGEKVIRRAVAAGFAVRSLLMAPRWVDALSDVLASVGDDVPCFVAPEPLIEQITGFHVHRGALASLHRLPLPPVEHVVDAARRVVVLEDLVDHTNVEYPSMRGDSPPASKPRRSRIAVLENLVDHANVGSAFRNAAALGVDAVLVTPACADPLYRRAVKTSMGNVFNVPWTRTGKMPETLDLLRAHGYTTVALTLSEDSITLDELVGRDLPALALVLGTEGAGVDPRTARQVDLRVRIPMEAGVDSLNVAAATAVTFYATR